MILPLAIVAQLAAQCAPQIASQTLLAIAKTESALDPLAIHDNGTGHSYAPADIAEALAIARRLWDEGHSFDAGLMQVNSKNMAWLQLKLEDAFDPCKSLGAAGALLVSFSRYNRGDGVRGFANGYVARVVAASTEQNSLPEHLGRAPSGRDTIPTALGAKPHQWNAFPDPAEDSWNQ